MYYPPPVYVVPPPAYYPPPVTYIQRPDIIQPGPQLSCDAGPYVCPLPRPASPGAACSCPTEKGRINGVVR
jgi:hypothetical protein